MEIIMGLFLLAGLLILVMGVGGLDGVSHHIDDLPPPKKKE